MSGLPTGSSARIDNRLPWLRVEEVRDNHGAEILHGQHSGFHQAMPGLKRTLQAEPFGQRRWPRGHPGGSKVGDDRIRRRPQPVHARVDWCRGVIGPAECDRVFDAGTPDPAIDQPAWMRVLHGDPSDRVVLCRQRTFTLIGDATEHRVHQRRRSGVAVPPGQVHRFMDDRAGRNTLQEQKLIHCRPQDGTDARRQLVKRIAQRAGDRPVEPRLMTQRAVDEFRGQPGVHRRQVSLSQLVMQEDVGKGPVRFHSRKHQRGDLAG